MAIVGDYPNKQVRVFKLVFSKTLFFYRAAFFFLIVLIFMSIVIFLNKPDTRYYYISGLFIISSFHIILPIMVHLNYLYYERNRVVEIDYNGKITIKNKTRVKQIIPEHIKNAIYIKKSKFGKYDFDGLGLDNYFYFKIFLNDGTQLKITCFMIDDPSYISFDLKYKRRILPLVI